MVTPTSRSASDTRPPAGIKAGPVASTGREHGAPVVLGTDGSSAAMNAARWTAYLAEALGAPIVVVHVRPIPGHRHTAGDDRSRSGKHRSPGRDEDAAGVVRRTARIIGTCTGHTVPHLVTETAASSVTAVLVEHSRRARILVVGAQTVFGERRTGPTTTGVAARAYCPVAVWRGVPGRPIRRHLPVVAAFDGTEYSSPALVQGFGLADTLGAALVVVRPAADRGAPGRWYGAPPRVPPSRVIGSVSQIAREHPSVTVQEFTESGHLADALVRRSAKAQLLLVSEPRTTAGRTPGPEVMFLLHHSMCPVLICRW